MKTDDVLVKQDINKDVLCFLKKQENMKVGESLIEHRQQNKNSKLKTG